MKKTFKVVMLPTEKESRLWLRGSDNKLILENNLQHNSTTVKGCQHLYILSDEEIKEGDWIYRDDKNYSEEIQQNTSGFIYKRGKFGWTIGMGKIVATTDKLNIHPNIADSYRSGNCLPQLSESFIQAYIKAYNEGNPITEVDLEIELHKWVGSTYPVGHRPTYQIKTRPDNTVIVHQSKMYSQQEYNKLLEQIGQMQLEMYTRDEVIKIIQSKIDEYANGAEKDIEYSALFEFKYWIEDNL